MAKVRRCAVPDAHRHIMIVRFLCQKLRQSARARVARPAIGGSAPTPQARKRLESIVVMFMDGFEAGLGGADMREKSVGVVRELLGFWFEGAAMGVVLRDWLMPWKRAR